jgi:glyoxylase I family protein
VIRDEESLKVARIDHVLLLVRGLSDALAFYEGTLGCEVENRMPQFGMVELRAGVSHIDLVDVADPNGAWARPKVEGGRNVDHVALAVQTLKAGDVRAHLDSRGVAVVEERVEERSVSFYVTDPSGNTVELVAAK